MLGEAQVLVKHISNGASYEYRTAKPRRTGPPAVQDRGRPRATMGRAITEVALHIEAFKKPDLPLHSQEVWYKLITVGVRIQNLIYLLLVPSRGLASAGEPD